MRASLAIRMLVVVVALAYSVCLSAGASSAPDVVPEPPDSTAATANETTAPDSTKAVEPSASIPDRIVVYYFHRTLRCDTCLKFETYTEEAIRSGFADELGDGTLEWHVVNLDDEGNGHFVDDYYIAASSVIAVGFQGGEQREWTNLDAIWGLVRNKSAFLSFIQGEVATRLGRVCLPEPAESSVRDTVAPPNEAPIGR